ncbi:MAG: kelch repeat-containing protein [bacterium]
MKNNEKGIAFVIVLIVIFVLSMVSIIYLLVSQTQLSKSYKQEQFTSALPTAEAGLDRAIWYLINDDKLLNWQGPTAQNPKVTITGYVDAEKQNPKKYYEAEIFFISGGGTGYTPLPPRDQNNKWYIHPALANMPRPKGNSAAVTINGVVFMFGGYGQPEKSTDDEGNNYYKNAIKYWGYRTKVYDDNVMIAYDPRNDTWQELGANPYGNKSKFAAVSYNNKMYMFGTDPDVIVYNPGNDMMSSTDDEWNKVASMESVGITDVNYHSAVVLGDKIYIVGGKYNNGAEYGLVIEFNPTTNQFTKLTPLPDGRYYGAAGVIDNKIYYVGGRPKTGMSMGADPVTGEVVITGNGQYTRTVWEYDPTTGISKTAAHIPWLEDDPDTLYLENISAWGGGDKIEGIANTPIYNYSHMHTRDPENCPYWNTEGYGSDHGLDLYLAMRPGLAEHQAVVVDNKIYVTGGNNTHLRSYFDGPGYTTENWKYKHGTFIDDVIPQDPDTAIKSKTTNEWTTKKDLYYDYSNGNPYGSYDSYRDWQGVMSGSYYRWNKKLYVFNGQSWTTLDDAPTMDMMTNGGMKGVGIVHQALASVDNRFYMLGGTAYHYRNPARQYFNSYVVEGEDTALGGAGRNGVNSMYVSVAEYYVREGDPIEGTGGQYKITVTSREQRLFGKTVHRRIEAIVSINSMTGANGYDGAIICKSDIDLTGNARTDSYNSDNGKYGPENALHGGNIFSNGNVSLTGNACVDGNAFSGLEETVNLTGNASVTGKKDSLGSDISLPAVTVPADAISTTIDITGSNELTLTEGTYTCNGIKISGQAQLIIVGKVKLYCTGNIDISGQGGANYEDNSNGDTTNFHIYCTNAVTSISLTGNDKFFGTVYAPAAEISVTGNGNVYGQLVGNEVDITGNGKVIYDEQLKNTIWWPEESKTGDVISWREVSL